MNQRSNPVPKRFQSLDRLTRALKDMENWARDLSEQSESNAEEGLERLRRGHCKQYNDAVELLHELSNGTHDIRRRIKE